MYPMGHSVGINPLVYVLMVGSVFFWGGVAFYAARKSLMEKQENLLTNLIAQVRAKKEGIFRIIAPASGVLALSSVGIEIYKVSHFSGVGGRFMFLGILAGLVTGISAAAAWYGNE